MVNWLLIDVLLLACIYHFIFARF